MDMLHNQYTQIRKMCGLKEKLSDSSHHAIQHSLMHVQLISEEQLSQDQSTQQLCFSEVMVSHSNVLGLHMINRILCKYDGILAVTKTIKVQE